MKLKASELRTIAIYSKIIPLYKKMGFKSDSQISILSENALYDIEIGIGEDLVKLKKEQSELAEKIRKPFIDQFEKETEGFDDEARSNHGQVNFDPKIKSAIFSNKDYNELITKEIQLWDKTITSDISPIEINDKEYAELLTGDPQTTDLFDQKFTFDGYFCLMQLISKKFGGEYFVKIKETE